MDRDLVHRQTACAVVQHMSLGELAAAHCAPIVCPLAAHCVYARRPVERLGLLSARLRLACVAYCVWLAVVVEGCPAVGCLLIGTLHCLLAGVAGLGCEDALMHLLNYVFPNVFEVSPHIIQASLVLKP